MLAPVTVAISGIGVYSIVSTLLWGRLLFGVPVHIEHLLLFAVSIPVAVLSIGLLGLVLASTFVLYRSASSLSQALEYPVWTITGMLIPLSLLPGLDRADRLGARADLGHGGGAQRGARRRRSARCCSARPQPRLHPALVLLLHHFERLARERATLSLT